MSAAPAPDPGLIFDTLNAYQRTAALRGAIDLDLFTAIAEGYRTASGLADRRGADPRAIRILCDFLVVCGFLEKRQDEYALTPTSAAFLDRRSPQYMGSMARFVNSPHLLEAFQDVAELVRRGTTLLPGSGTVEPEYDGWVEFARVMVPLMMPAARFIAEQIADRVNGPLRVLDVAAGHGMFGISVAQRLPEAHVVALDWEQVLQVAAENARQAGIEHRHSLLPGDALKMDLGSGYDVVLITNFFHHFDSDTCLSLMRKVAESLREGGIAITLEFMPDENRVAPPASATFSFVMLGTTPAGDAYTFSEYDALWRTAGLTASEWMDVPNSSQRVIISRKERGNHVTRV